MLIFFFSYPSPWFSFNPSSSMQMTVCWRTAWSCSDTRFYQQYVRQRKLEEKGIFFLSFFELFYRQKKRQWCTNDIGLFFIKMTHSLLCWSKQTIFLHFSDRIELVLLKKILLCLPNRNSRLPIRVSNVSFPIIFWCVHMFYFSLIISISKYVDYAKK
jgi:hypothetical protein